MRRATCPVLAFALLAFAAPADASSAGAALYVPPRPVQPASYSTPGCVPGAPCHTGQRIGFAGVDGATPPPCTAEGGCYPNRSTYGYTPTRWRQWPGAVYNQDGPELAVEDEDSLLPPFDPPAPEDEDQQAPASISDEEEAAAQEESADGPAVEITLPPFEEGPIDTPRPPAAPGLRDGPPALPFGFRDDDQSGARRVAAPAPTRWSLPPAADSSPRPPAGPRIDKARPVRSLPPVKSASREDDPPPLPGGFTATPRPGLRRLPSVDARYDAAVTPASAIGPLSGGR